MPKTTGLNFGTALSLLRGGLHATRDGWNDANQWIALQVPDRNSKMTLPYISTVTGDLVPWLASQTDILAEDWRLA